MAAAIVGLIVSQVASPHSPKAPTDHAWSVSSTSILQEGGKSGVFTEFDKAGGDRSKPVVVDFHSYFDSDSHAEAEAAGRDLRRDGFTIVDERIDTGEWGLTASKRMTMVPAVVDRVEAEVETIVDDHGGVYDGFGAALTPK